MHPLYTPLLSRGDSDWSDDSIGAVRAERARITLESMLARIAVTVISGISAAPGAAAPTLGVADRYQRRVNAVANCDVDLEDVAAIAALAAHTAIAAAAPLATGTGRLLIVTVSAILATPAIAAAAPLATGLAEAAGALHHITTINLLDDCNISTEWGRPSGIPHLPGQPWGTIIPFSAGTSGIVVIPPQCAPVIGIPGATRNIGRRSRYEADRCWWKRIGILS
jgi:hypothetical protein